MRGGGLPPLEAGVFTRRLRISGTNQHEEEAFRCAGDTAGPATHPLTPAPSSRRPRASTRRSTASRPCVPPPGAETLPDDKDTG